MVVSDDELGLQGGHSIQRRIEDSGGCVAFMEQVHLRYSKEKVLQLAEMIRKHTAKVVIVHSPEIHVKLLLETLYGLNVSSKVWILTASFTITPWVLANQAWRILNGSLGIVPYTEHMLGFEEFLRKLKPASYPKDVFIKLFWKKAFHCIFPDSNGTSGVSTEGEKSGWVPCSGEETLNEEAMALFELNELSYTYQGYTAVYAFASALNTLLRCVPGKGPFKTGSCADINNIKPWQPILEVFNEAKSCGQLSSSQREALIVFLPKPGRDPLDVHSNLDCKVLGFRYNRRRVKAIEEHADSSSTEARAFFGTPSLNLFMADVSKTLKWDKLVPTAPRHLTPSHLAHADAVVLLSLSKTGMQRSVNELLKYTKVKLEINNTETKTMVLRNCFGHPLRIYPDDEILEEVNSNKYLGASLDNKANFAEQKRYMTQKAKVLIEELRVLCKGREAPTLSITEDAGCRVPSNSSC
ncbi:hypothetical protein NDU88_009507 [Pleurodeles waltl]|uniref:Receptor ligand binding region domain-containing protein n=1 Tax=Pleurodeles waltl TaxID=8319 RepID=A0AAV7P461_PLEWA|nr:hypothetical protein NDU88_009507 [Pleurodeles waltl]